MTRDQIVSFVCGKVNQTDAMSLAFCADAVNRRYQMIWDEANWLDAMVDAPVSVVAGTSDYAVPAAIERVVKIATPTGTIEPTSLQVLIDSYPELIAGSGAPKFYTEFVISGVQSFRLYPNPNAAVAIRPYGKRVFAALGASNVPVIRNIDNCLIAFAQADMLERQRQYAKSGEKVKEAGALLVQMKAVETERANRPRMSAKLTVSGDSLAEMTDAVSARVRDYTVETRLLIQDYLRRNYQDIYDSQLWPESGVAANMDRDGAEVVLPEYFDRVVGVRQNVNIGGLQAVEQGLYFQIDPAIFERSGSPVAFSMLTSVGVPVLPPVNENLRFVSTSDADVGVEIMLRGESQGVEVNEIVVLNGTLDVASERPYDTPITVGKPLTAGDITISGFTSATFLGELLAAERERKHLRLWIQPTPTTNDGAKALICGKRKCKPLVHDSDTPILRGCGNLLIYMSCECVFASQGNAAMAKDFAGKAQAALQGLIDREIKQNAFSQRVIPNAEGYGCGGSCGYYDSMNFFA